jgi:hypothetical protein
MNSAPSPLILPWIQQTLAKHAAKARPVASLNSPRLPRYFSPGTLASAKVVGANVVPLPPLAALGLSQYADFEHMSASGIGQRGGNLVSWRKPRRSELPVGTVTQS